MTGVVERDDQVGRSDEPEVTIDVPTAPLGSSIVGGYNERLQLLAERAAQRDEVEDLWTTRPGNWSNLW